MVNNLEIKNFKSIRYLKLENCRRVNVFIGKPNTGKSNLLEVIGFLSHLPFGKISDFVRFEEMSNLFYDEILEDDVVIGTDELDPVRLGFREDDNLFSIQVGQRIIKTYNSGGIPKHSSLSEADKSYLSQFKFYRFFYMDRFPGKRTGFLTPPKGDNLANALTHHKEIRELISQLFDEFNFKFVVKPREKKIEIQRELEDGVVISFPHYVISDTLKRMVFYLTAIMTNKESFIALEEPESHAFPYYTKYLAEKISFDKNNNQYFISTHNPYFLLSILQKTPMNELAVFITYYDDDRTNIRQLGDKELKDILDAGTDVFFNIEKFLDTEVKKT